MNAPDHNGSDWQRLLRVALHLIEQVNEESRIVDYWSLGGGTALMVHINHRQSRDIDIGDVQEIEPEICQSGDFPIDDPRRLP